jgi:hypothetical protein
MKRREERKRKAKSSPVPGKEVCLLQNPQTSVFHSRYDLLAGLFIIPIMRLEGASCDHDGSPASAAPRQLSLAAAKSSSSVIIIRMPIYV